MMKPYEISLIALTMFSYNPKQE